MKNQFRIETSPDPINFREAVSILYVDNKFIDPSRIKNTAFDDFNDKSLKKFSFFLK